MKKKLYTTLTALITAMSTFPLSASANIAEIEGDFCQGSGPSMNLFVRTDGTELTLDMLSDYEGISYVRNCTTAGDGQYVTELEIDSNCYLISYRSSLVDSPESLGRQLMLELDYVEEVYTAELWGYSNASWDYVYLVTAADENVVIDTDTIPELAEFEMEFLTYLENTYSFTLTDPENSEFKAEMNAANLGSYYEEYLYMEEYGNQIEEKYNSILTNVEVEVIADLLTIYTTITPTSIWQTAGDPNADGAVDAKDAASILQTAAENGTGAGIAATSATDVNADGEVNAKDAAAVLVYAAEEGAGKTPDWVEILRR